MFNEEDVKIYVQGPNDEPTPEPEQPPIPSPDAPPLSEPQPERREYIPEHIEPDEPWEQD